MVFSVIAWVRWTVQVSWLLCAQWDLRRRCWSSDILLPLRQMAQCGLRPVRADRLRGNAVRVRCGAMRKTASAPGAPCHPMLTRARRFQDSGFAYSGFVLTRPSSLGSVGVEMGANWGSCLDGSGSISAARLPHLRMLGSSRITAMSVTGNM